MTPRSRSSPTMPLGCTWFCLGALPAARQHLEEGIARYTPDQRRAPVFRMGQDPGVGCRAYAAWTLWLLGYPEQALARLHEALALAHELSHPYSLAFARCVGGLRLSVSPGRAGRARARRGRRRARDRAGLSTLGGLGTSLRGWALAMQGQGEEGMAQVRQGIAAWRATGAALLVPYFCTVLAEVSDHLGHTEDGLQALAEAHTLVEQHEERWWEAEIYRLRGVLLLRQPGTPQAEAETWLQRALDVARRQEAKSLELRAAMSLSAPVAAAGQARRSPRRCWRRSMAGSPRALTPLTCRRPRRCSRRYRMNMRNGCTRSGKGQGRAMLWAQPKGKCGVCEPACV